MGIVLIVVDPAGTNSQLMLKLCSADTPGSQVSDTVVLSVTDTVLVNCDEVNSGYAARYQYSIRYMLSGSSDCIPYKGTLLDRVSALPHCR